MPGNEFPSTPLERLNPRRTTWGDERGHDLMITHHGESPHLLPLPCLVADRETPATHACAHAHRDSCARPPTRATVHDTHYKRSFYRRHRFE